MNWFLFSFSFKVWYPKRINFRKCTNYLCICSWIFLCVWLGFRHSIPSRKLHDESFCTVWLSLASKTGKKDKSRVVWLCGFWAGEQGGTPFLVHFAYRKWHWAYIILFSVMCRGHRVNLCHFEIYVTFTYSGVWIIWPSRIRIFQIIRTIILYTTLEIR